MYRIIEIVGTSPDGYSQAVRDAVNKVVPKEGAAAWFEVVEQRGAIDDGELSEYQVKLKVAVDVRAAVAKQEPDGGDPSKSVCPTCQKSAAEGGHLCVPLTRKDKTCDWCGSMIVNERHLCEDKVKELAYICNTCGRTAVKEENLCNPRKIKK